MDDYELLETEMFELLSMMSKYLTEEAKNELTEYITNNESWLAFEDICRMIRLDDIPLTSDIFDKITKIGKLMNYNNEFISNLKNLIKD